MLSGKIHRVLSLTGVLSLVCLIVVLFGRKAQHGTKSNYPLKFDSRTLERHPAPGRWPGGECQEEEMAAGHRHPSPLPLGPELPALIHSTRKKAPGALLQPQ